MTFVGASLVECDFTDTFWINETVDFTGANLAGSIMPDRQLTRSILENSILPNGTWGPIISENLIVNGDAEQNVSLGFYTFFIYQQISTTFRSIDKRKYIWMAHFSIIVARRFFVPLVEKTNISHRYLILYASVLLTISFWWA